VGVRGSDSCAVTEAEAASNGFDINSETRRNEFTDQSLWTLRVINDREAPTIAESATDTLSSGI